MQAAKSTAMKGRPITEQEFKRMLAAVENVVGNEAVEEWIRILKGLFESSLRLRELLHLTWDDPRFIRPIWEVGKEPGESNLSQVFLVMDPSKLSNDWQSAVDGIIRDMQTHEDEGVYYPGQRTLKTRQENLEKGVPVVEEFWQQVLNF